MTSCLMKMQMIPVLNHDPKAGSDPDCPHFLAVMSQGENIHMKTAVADTTTGVLKAIFWLREMGRPMLADKMERELLYADNMRQNPTRNQDSGTCSR